MMSTSARLISSAAADCPIARPSEELWSPMPMAIRRNLDRFPHAKPTRNKPSAVYLDRW